MPLYRTTTLPRTCAYCGYEFFAPLWRILDGNAKFCSRDCYNAARRADNPTFICQECGCTFQSDAARVRRGDVIRFCGDACYRIHQKAHVIPVADRFWAMVDVTATCWLWTGARDEKGYGVFGVKAGDVVFAHRFAYELSYDTLDPALSVLHRCDNPPCVRPDHLFQGTHADNAQDMRDKDRHTRGERSATAVLTDAQIRQIRARYAAGGISQLALAHEYGVSEMTVNKAIHHKTWKHID